LFDGQGLYQNDKTGIIYEGIFIKGKRSVVPNVIHQYNPLEDISMDDEEESKEEKPQKGKSQKSKPKK